MFFMALSFGMWKDHVIFVAADINSSKSRWQSLHNIFNTFFLLNMFFLVCIWAVLVSHTWSPELLNWHFREIFTHDKTAKLPHCCLAWYQWLHIPHVFQLFQSWLWRISQGFKADDKHRNYIVWLNKITEDVKIDIQ